MGSKSTSQTSSTNTTQDFTFNNVDNAVGGDVPGGAKINFNLANSKAENISIVNSDQGAISAARDIALQSLDFGYDALTTSQNITQSGIDAVIDSTRDASEESLTQFFKVAGVVILGVVIMGFFKK